MGVISNLMFAVGFKVQSSSLAKAGKDVNKLKSSVNGLDSPISKATRSTKSLTSAFAGISSTAGVFGGMATKAVGLAGAIGAVAAAGGLMSKSLGGAMQLEQTQMQIEALAGSAEQGMKIFDMVNDMGLKSVFSEKDFLDAGKTFMPITKDLGELNKILSVTERLASKNPLEGMQGAAFSINELASGDIASIAERFNIGKMDLRAAGFDSAKGYKNNIAALDKVLTQYGFTQEYVNKVNKSGSAQWDMFKSNISAAVARSGTAALNLLKGPLEGINKWMGDGGISRMTDVLSRGLASTVNFAVTAGSAIGGFLSRNGPGIERFGITALGVFTGIASVAEDFWNTLQPVTDLIGGALAGAFTALAPDVISLSSAIMDVGKSFVQWEGFAPMVYGIAAAFGAYKLVMLATTLQTTLLSAATKAYIGFQTALNVVMSLNPIGLVVAALVGLGVALVLAYQKSETFRDIVNGVWQGMKIGFAATMNFFTETVPAVFNGIVDFFKEWGPLMLAGLTGPVGLAVAMTSKYWEEIKSSFVVGADFVIGIVNKMIAGINSALNFKLPDWLGGKEFSINIPNVPTLSSMIAGSHANGLAHVPYDGYIAELHEGERVLTADENRDYRAAAYTPANAPASVTNSRVSNAAPVINITQHFTISGNHSSDTVRDFKEQMKQVIQEVIESSMRRDGIPEGAN